MSDAILQTWTEPSKARPRLRVPPRLLRAVASIPLSLLRVGFAIGLLAALVVLVLTVATLRLASPRVTAQPAQVAVVSGTPTWIEIVKPVRIYSLEARDLAKLPLTYAARRRSVGEAREDILTFGSWHADQPSLRLSVLRNGAEPKVPLDTAIVRQAASVGLSVGHSKLPDTLPTRFGSFEIADVDTKGTGTALQCSGFRLQIVKPVLVMDGFACGAESRVIARRSLGCLIDRLDLASAGDDRASSDFFAATDLKRSAQCDGMRLGPDAMHAAWLDEKDAPAPAASKRRKAHHRH